jgi:iron complex outermembrane receptor protein
MAVRHFVTGTSVIAIALCSQTVAAQSTTVPADTVGQQSSAPGNVTSKDDPQTNAAPVDAAATDAAAADGAQGIGDVVVTATRREQRLQSVPLAVTAISGETLKDRGVVDISRLNEFVPGFSFGQTGSDVRPAMRGVRTAQNGVTGDPTIGYFIDGIYQSRTSQAALGFADVATLEVQRGPQGTLYGRNTFGGNIVVTTNAPTHDLDYGSTITVGNYKKIRYEGYVNVPLTDNLAARIVLVDDFADGWVRNRVDPQADLFDENKKYVRGALKWDVGDFSATLRGDYVHQGGNGNSAFGYKQIGSYVDPASCQTLFNASYIGLNERAGNRDGVADCRATVASPALAVGAGADLGVPIEFPGKWHTIGNNYKPYRDLSQASTSLNASYDLGPVSLRSITGYVHYRGKRTTDSDFSASSIAIDFARTQADTFTQEVQLLSNTKGRLEYVVGGFFLNDNLVNGFINQQLPRTIVSSALPAPITAPANNGTYQFERVKVYSRAAYGQATFHLTDAWSVTGGVRYTHEKKTYLNATAYFYLPTTAPGGANPLTLVTINDPLPSDSIFPARPSNCGQNGVTAATILTPAGAQVLSTYCPLTFSQVTWKGGTEYKITDRNLVYASVSTGFRSGGFNAGLAASQSAPTFNPEKVIAYELGSKNRFFDNTLQLNLSAFYNRYSDLQESRQIIVGGTTLQTVFNAAKARSYGLETEAIWQPTKALTIGANLSLLNAKYTQFRDVTLPFAASILVNDATATSATVVNGITVAGVGQRRILAPGYNCAPQSGTGGAGQPGLAFVCDLSGNNIPHSPKYSGAVYASYRLDLGGDSALVPFAAVAFAGHHDEQSFNDYLGRAPTWQKLDLSLTYEYNKQLSIEGFVDNVTDSKIQTLVSYGGTSLQASYEPPRMYGMRLRFQR